MIRDFLYVDVQRTRSLLAQLEDGVIEQYVKRTALDDAGELGASIFGIGGKGAWSSHESCEESRSLKDLTFVVFEGAAEAQGLIVNVEVAKALGQAQMEALQAQLQKANPGQRKQIERKLKSAEVQVEAEARREVEAQLGGAAGMDQMRSVMKVLGSFIGEAIAVRLLSCGLDHPEMGFAGSLLARDEYLQRERDELFSRYGSILRGWTTVMQVAHVPADAETTSAMGPDAASLEQLASGQAINRAAFERTAAQLLRMMESIGITEGPRWPTVSVVPLAIYRQGAT